MAIRHAKVACTLTWEQRKALTEEAGTEIGYARVTLPGRGLEGELKLFMDNGKDEQLGLFYVEADKTSHEGRVVEIEVDRSVRIMSDVWADITYAVVYEPTRMHTGVASTEKVYSVKNADGSYGTKNRGACGTFRRVQIANTEFRGPSSELIRAAVDAPSWLMEVYEAWKAGAALRSAMNKYDREQQAILDERRYVKKDRWVRVTRGRKVKQGTEGLVFWLGASQWGTKVGIALPQEDGTFRKEEKAGRYGKTFESYKDVAWTYLKNVSVIDKPGGRIL